MEKKKRRKVLNLFAKVLMSKGQRDKAEKILISVLYRLRKLNLDLDILLNNAVQKVRPRLAIKIVKVAGRKLKVPYHYPKRRSVRTGLYWIIQSVKEANYKNFEEGLVIELLKASSGQGNAFNQMRSLIKTGIQNRFYLKYLKSRKKREFHFKKWERYLREDESEL